MRQADASIHEIGKRKEISLPLFGVPCLQNLPECRMEFVQEEMNPFFGPWQWDARYLSVCSLLKNHREDTTQRRNNSDHEGLR
jgi:hypothetical protein